MRGRRVDVRGENRRRARVGDDRTSDAAERTCEVPVHFDAGGSRIVSPLHASAPIDTDVFSNRNIKIALILGFIGTVCTRVIVTAILYFVTIYSHPFTSVTAAIAGKSAEPLTPTERSHIIRTITFLIKFIVKFVVEFIVN